MSVREAPADPIMARAIKALSNALISTKQGLTLSSSGYVPNPSENLLDGISLQDIEADFRQGAGDELGRKFRAAHSSSALAANNFAPFKLRPGSLRLAEVSALGVPQFERKCPTGLVGILPTSILLLRTTVRSSASSPSAPSFSANTLRSSGLPMQTESVMSVVRVPGLQRWFV